MSRNFYHHLILVKFDNSVSIVTEVLKKYVLHIVIRWIEDFWLGFKAI